MHARHILPVLALASTVILISTLSFPVFGQSGIVVNNADAIQNTSVSISQDLVDLANSIQPRIVTQYANTVCKLNLSNLPAALHALLEQLTVRIVFQYVDTNRVVNLSSSEILPTLLEQIAPRIIFQYANTTRHLLLGFPVDLINDTTPPQGSNITAKSAGETSATVTWVTDEYADSTVRCGTQPGNYTMTFSDPLYVKPHSITLTGLTAGTTYYCVCSSTDPSGNTYQSQQFSFKQVEEVFIYLPLVLRNK